MIVLGTQVKGETLSRSLEYRMETAVRYAKIHPNTVFILSGGKGKGEDVSEAFAMYEYMKANGIPEYQMILEEQSTSTYENLVYSRLLIAEREEDRRTTIRDVMSAAGYLSPPDEEVQIHVGIITSNFHMLRAKGIGKGDMVMVVLKRHYQFWFTILALHKLGAVIIPATFLLTKHDIVYRVNSASVKAVICTGQGDVAAHFDESAPECPTLQTKLMVNGERDGWEDFMTEMEKAPESFARVPTLASDPMILYFSSGTTGNPKSGAAPLHLCPGPSRHREILAQRRPGGHPLHHCGHRLGQGGLGQALWANVYGELRIRL